MAVHSLFAQSPRFVQAPANCGLTLFGSPDGIWADADGRLWIQTDISNGSQNRPDRGYDWIKNSPGILGRDRPPS